MYGMVETSVRMTASPEATYPIFRSVGSIWLTRFRFWVSVIAEKSGVGCWAAGVDRDARCPDWRGGVTNVFDSRCQPVVHTGELGRPFDAPSASSSSSPSSSSPSYSSYSPEPSSSTASSSTSRRR